MNMLLEGRTVFFRHSRTCVVQLKCIFLFQVTVHYLPGCFCTSIRIYNPLLSLSLSFCSLPSSSLLCSHLFSVPFLSSPLHPPSSPPSLSVSPLYPPSPSLLSTLPLRLSSPPSISVSPLYPPSLFLLPSLAQTCRMSGGAWPWNDSCSPWSCKCYRELLVI